MRKAKTAGISPAGGGLMRDVTASANGDQHAALHVQKSRHRGLYRDITFDHIPEGALRIISIGCRLSTSRRPTSAAELQNDKEAGRLV
jgi:hypothetical protein